MIMGVIEITALMKTIRKLREQKGWTQKDLAQQSGVEYSMMNRYENGNAYPTFKTLQKIATALGCTVSQIVGLEEGGISSEELFVCAQPLIELLQNKGNPMMVVHVTDEGADLYVAQCGTGKRPRED